MGSNDSINELEIRKDKDAVIFNISVLPKSSRNMVVGVVNGALKIKLTAAPVDNAANKLCVSYLSKCLDLPKSSVEIVSGHTGKNKQIRITYPEKTHSKIECAEIIDKIKSLVP